MAVIGAGRWGPHLIRNFHDLSGCEVLWVVDNDPSRLGVVAERFRGIATTADAAEALADPRVDAIVIATPTSTHYELIRQALLHNKHVLVEKPLTNNSDSARVLCELAKSRGRVLMVGHVFLFNPSIQAAQEYLAEGSLGRVYYLSMERTNLGPVRRDVNAAWDLASHDVAIANYWLGDQPQAVSAQGGAWLNPHVEDVAFLTLRYPNDTLVHIEASWLHPRKSRRISVIGEHKMLTVDDMQIDEPLRIYDMSVVGDGDWADTFVGFRSQIREGAVTIPRIGIHEPLREECARFLARVAGSQDRLSDGWFGLGVVRAIEAADLSMKDGGREVLLSEA